MKILISKSAQKEFDSLGESWKRRLQAKIFELKNFPDISNLKKLKSLKNIFRLKIGTFRIIFVVEDKNIKITHIRKRNEKTYKNLK